MEFRTNSYYLVVSSTCVSWEQSPEIFWEIKIKNYEINKKVLDTVANILISISLPPSGVSQRG